MTREEREEFKQQNFDRTQEAKTYLLGVLNDCYRNGTRKEIKQMETILAKLESWQNKYCWE